MKHDHHPYQPIENYGIIGNLRTVALVGLNGSIDFMSFPRFDSATIFAAILDENIGGFFSVEPIMPGYKSKQMYIPGTAVLLTRFFSDEGIAEITDYMPMSEDNQNTSSAIIRRIKTIRGHIRFRMKCAPRFDYARAEHLTSLKNDQVIFSPQHDGNAKLRLIADVPLQLHDQDAFAEFTVSETDKEVYIVLESIEEGQEDVFESIEHYAEHTYRETISDWRRWLKKSTYKGSYSEIVFRSAITLKLLTSCQFGSAIAAATFSLPETIGGNRNWDYRFTWTRDAAFTMYAFLRLGMFDEATNFLTWILDLCKDQHLQLIYGVDGKTDLVEKELDHLDGYKGSKPVRIGNAAKDQLQIDIYGELIDTIYIYNKSYKPITFEFWTAICGMVEMVMDKWQQPDHGIWEVRAETREFLHTRLMCWVAMDRAIKIAEHRSFPYDINKWAAVRNEIYHDIYHNFWNEDLGAWVQYKGADVVDASVLLMPLTHFIAPQEPRWLSTMKVVDEQLRLDVLIYRYQDNETDVDGLEGEEGTFTMCSFWFIEALAKSGQIDRAVENFEKMMGYANHLGLFSEELGKKGEHLGNFPQAFTHLALISAAMELDKQLSRL